MSRPRVSIAGLLGVVLISALGMAALSRPSELWASAIFTLSVALLVFSLLVAFRGKGRARAYWQGFSLFGWSYAALAFAPWLTEEVRPMLLTTQLLDRAYPQILGSPLYIAHNVYAGLGPQGFAQARTTRRHPSLLYSDEPMNWLGSPNYLEYQRIGHSLMITLSGLFGGWLSLAIGPASGPTEVAMEPQDTPRAS